jgi:hypothetical protein
MAASPAIFGAHAVALRRAGLAVLPAQGKRPIRAGFNRWRHAPGVAVVEKWAAESPGANIVFVPGLSRDRHPHGLVVVDADNATEVERAEQIFGRTPGMVDTRRGRHFLYRAPEGSLDKIGSLRKSGFDIDVKHGQEGSGISVVPPSVHPSGHVYAWSPGSGIEALDELPPFDVRALQALLERRVGLPTAMAHPEVRAPAAVREGERNNTLWRACMRRATKCGSFDDLLDFARARNAEFEPPLEDAEVMRVAKSAWDYTVRGENWFGRGQEVRVPGDVVASLAADHPDAISLLLILQIRHGGATADFALANKMAKSMGWTLLRFRSARDRLIDEGLLRRIHRGGQGPHDPPVYALPKVNEIAHQY